MKFYKLSFCYILAAASITCAADALGGYGEFNVTGLLTGWTKYINTEDYYYSAAQIGSITINTNDDGETVAEFWSNAYNYDEWDIQLKRTITLEKGYAYTITTGFYSYDKKGTAGRAVQMGVLDSDYDTYFAEEFKNSTGEYEAFIGTTYDHCSATDSKASFYINGGTQYGGFAIPWVKIIKEPSSLCGSSIIVSSSSTSTPKSSSATQLNGNRIGPVAQYGQLQTGTNADGQGRIYGSCPTWSVSGKEVQIKGMSLFWSINAASAAFWDASVITRMVKEHNIQLIRAAMGVDEEWGDGNYFTSTRYYQNLMDDVVQAAIDNDIYVIIDYHSHRAHEDVTSAKEFFTRMASKWGDYDNVIFEIFNEPACITGGTGDCSDIDFGGGYLGWSSIRTYANQVISVIREYSDNLIIVGTPMWDQQPNVAINSKVTDKDNNTAYAFHYYAGTHSTSVEGANAVKAMNAGLSVFVSEWGTINADGKGAVASANTTWQNWMNTHKLSSANWSLTNLTEDGSGLYGGDGQGGSYFSATTRPTSTTWNYSKSGTWLNTNVFDNLPSYSDYTACAGTVTPKSSSSSAIITSSSSSNKSSSSTTISSSSSKTVVSSSSIIPKSSSSSSTIVSSSSETTITNSFWEPENTVLTFNSSESVIFGKSLSGKKRVITRNLSLIKSEYYIVSFIIRTEDEEGAVSVKVADGDNKLCVDALDISPKETLVTCDFEATSNSATLTVSVSGTDNDIILFNYALANGTDAIKAAQKSAFGLSVTGKRLHVASTSNEAATVQVFDIMGNMVLKAFKTADVNEISLEKLTNGTYIIRVQSKNGEQALKASLH